MNAPKLTHHKPALLLAPMEGITHAAFREIMARSGTYDLVFTEFVRVSENVLSTKFFQKHFPELGGSHQHSNNYSKLFPTVPTIVQILGGDPERIAESALHALEAGAHGIDLNFGCPAPTVNRHDGGATLLKFPHRLEQIVKTVRNKVPSAFPVSAKVRLGFDDPRAIYENAKRIEGAGADWITIHGRTKTQGYTPPAYWEPIGEIQRLVKIPVVANGEIWTLNDFKRCKEITGCQHFMIGRASLAFPNLAKQIREHLGLPFYKFNLEELDPPPPHDLNAKVWAQWFKQYIEISSQYVDVSSGFEKKLKQWSRFLNQKQPIDWWDPIKTLGSTEEILKNLNQHP